MLLIPERDGQGMSLPGEEEHFNRYNGNPSPVCLDDGPKSRPFVQG